MISNTMLLISGAKCRACGEEQIVIKNPIPLLSEGGYFLYCFECGGKQKAEKPETVTTVKLGKLGGKFQIGDAFRKP